MYIELKPEERVRISNIFTDPLFKKVINKIIEEKKEVIVNQAEDLDLLHKLRYSLDGNKEILDEFEKIHLEYMAEVNSEKVDPNAII